MQAAGKVRKNSESDAPKPFYEFGPFRVDPLKRILLRDGQPVPLTGKAFDILVVLLEARGETLTKDRLMERVWAGTVVEEGNLSRNVSTLRKALGESPDQHRYIVTLPGLGYRFVAKVREVAKEAEEPAPQEAPPPQTISPHGAARPEPTTPLTSGPEALVEVRSWRLPGRTFALLASAVVVVVTFALIVAWWHRQLGRRAASPIRSLAVLPLANLSGDPSQEYFVDGITDELITDLAQVDALRVVSHTSVMRYKGGRTALPEIARELKVDAVVEGSVSRFGDEVRIRAQLVRVATDTHLWAQSYEGSVKDVLTLQSRVASAITRAIQVKLTPAQQARLDTTRPVDPTAHEAYLKGRYLWRQRTAESLKQSIDCFEQAIQKDPGYAEGYAGLADAYTVMVANDQMPTRAGMPQAEAAAQKALSLEVGLAEAHASLAFVKFNFDRDPPGAEREFRAALDLDPGYATAHHWYGAMLMWLGRFEQASREIQRARDIDPFSPGITAALASNYYFWGHYEDSLALTQQLLAANPTFYIVHSLLALNLAKKGMTEAAISEFEKSLALERHPYTLMWLGNLYGVSGRRHQALKLVEELARRSGPDQANAYPTAVIWAGLGENDRALDWLDKAFEERESDLVMIKVEPSFDRLRTNPRFQRLMRHIGLVS
jgi:TolB-like protein/DNA-binding winged helix-turn-helix (wHTH) protein/tetratricopeptide (TPR) repeat protein